MSVGNKHPHYHKDVRHLETIDVYRVLHLFNVTDPCIQHAVKKLLVAGGRGAGKDINKDIQEAIDSLNRFQEMRQEDAVPDMKKLDEQCTVGRDRFQPEQSIEAGQLGGSCGQYCARAGDRYGCHCCNMQGVCHSNDVGEQLHYHVLDDCAECAALVPAATTIQCSMAPAPAGLVDSAPTCCHACNRQDLRRSCKVQERETLVNKMRVSLTQRGDEIRGTVELCTDGVFVLEGLAMVVEQFAIQHNVQPEEVVQDLYAIVLGKVK